MAIISLYAQHKYYFFNVTLYFNVWIERAGFQKSESFASDGFDGNCTRAVRLTNLDYCLKLSRPWSSSHRLPVKNITTCQFADHHNFLIGADVCIAFRNSVTRDWLSYSAQLLLCIFRRMGLPFGFQVSFIKKYELPIDSRNFTLK